MKIIQKSTSHLKNCENNRNDKNKVYTIKILFENEKPIVEQAILLHIFIEYKHCAARYKDNPIHKRKTTFPRPLCNFNSSVA